METADGRQTELKYDAERFNNVLDTGNASFGIRSVQCSDVGGKSVIFMEFVSTKAMHVVLKMLESDAIVYLSREWQCKSSIRKVMAAMTLPVRQGGESRTILIETSPGTVTGVILDVIFN